MLVCITIFGLCFAFKITHPENFHEKISQPPVYNTTLEAKSVKLFIAFGPDCLPMFKPYYLWGKWQKQQQQPTKYINRLLSLMFGRVENSAQDLSC
jgi:hypothetical protein